MFGKFGSVRWPRIAAGLAALVAASGLALAAPADPAPAPAPAPHHAQAAAKPAVAKVDINSATKEELAKLPGIGDAYSQKIIDGRPYKSKAELESKKILPKGVYDKISARVIAHQQK